MRCAHDRLGVVQPIAHPQEVSAGRTEAVSLEERTSSHIVELGDCRANRVRRRSLLKTHNRMLDNGTCGRRPPWRSGQITSACAPRPSCPCPRQTDPPGPYPAPNERPWDDL